MKIHFDAQGKGRYYPKNAECGTTGKKIVVFIPAEMTTDPEKVTCKRCRITKAFKDAAP